MFVKKGQRNGTVHGARVYIVIPKNGGNCFRSGTFATSRKPIDGYDDPVHNQQSFKGQGNGLLGFGFLYFGWYPAVLLDEAQEVMINALIRIVNTILTFGM
jgi:hypothetical protein